MAHKSEDVTIGLHVANKEAYRNTEGYSEERTYQNLSLVGQIGKTDKVIINESEDEVQGNESRGSHEQDTPDNNRPTPSKHKR